MDGITPLRVGDGATPLADVQAAARAIGTPLVWLLDVSAEPEEGALAALRAAGSGPAASVPVDSAGRPLDAWIGTFAGSDLEAILQGAAQCHVPLHFTPLYSLLAPRDLIAAEAPPDPGRYGPFADLEWTARLFRRRSGVLVGASEVRMRPRRVAPAPLALARLVRSEGFRLTDGLRLWRIAASGRR